MRRGLVDRVALQTYADDAAGLHGSVGMRRLAPLAEPAESPMETRLRWQLLEAGLPRPEVQRDLYDVNGEFIGRVDLYYPSAKLVIEFDGGDHRYQLISDNRRQNMILSSGFRMLRFTSSDLFGRPESVAAQVRDALAASPRPAGYEQNRRIPAA
jgi:very-short-patch-repair endonuclease